MGAVVVFNQSGVYTDGTNWNPSGGRGIYAYTTWTKL